jgi:hypothetical protein
MKVAHSVGALGKVVNIRHVGIVLLMGLLIFKVCSDEEHFIVQVQWLGYRSLERPCRAHEL